VQDCKLNHVEVLNFSTGVSNSMNRTKAYLLIGTAMLIAVVASLLSISDEALLAQKAGGRESVKQIWEYKVINSNVKEGIVEEANVLATQGWEIVNVVIGGEIGMSERYTAFLKRMKPRNPAP
jgi:hypothetical protein